MKLSETEPDEIIPNAAYIKKTILNDLRNEVKDQYFKKQDFLIE